MNPYLHIEVLKKLTSKIKDNDLEEPVLEYLKSISHLKFNHEEKTPFKNVAILNEHVEQINVGEKDSNHPPESFVDPEKRRMFEEDNQDLSEDQLVGDFHQYYIKVHIYQLDPGGLQSEDMEDDTGDTGEVSCASNHCVLPSQEFHGLYETLIYDDNIKDTLLQYAETSMMFSMQKVNSNLISWNRVILLHGPPGTGKTSLCKAIAQKLAIRLKDTYKVAEFIEINSHSLFSKYFSESGKLVQKMFNKIKKSVEYEDGLVCLLIDEIESLTRARESVLSGTEPSDGVRVVNAVLTQLDQLKRYSNVLIFTTSNLTGAIDLAFVDRADIKQYIGFPSACAIYKIYQSSYDELVRASVISPDSEHYSYKRLKNISKQSVGLSGRTLRKLPFLTFVKYIREPQPLSRTYLNALEKTVRDTIKEKRTFSDITNTSSNSNGMSKLPKICDESTRPSQERLSM